MDSDRNPLVTVEFSDVSFNSTFDKNDFNVQKNMTGAQLDKTVMAEPESREFSVKYPEEIPGVRFNG